MIVIKLVINVKDVIIEFVNVSQLTCQKKVLWLEGVEDGNVDIRSERFGGGLVNDARHVIVGWHVDDGYHYINNEPLFLS